MLNTFIKKNWLVITLIIFYCVVQYVYFFTDGHLVLGAEGHYWHDFTIYLKNQGFTWLNIGTGETTSSINAIFLYPFLASLIKNKSVLSYLITASIYILPVIGMYALLTCLNKTNRIQAALLSFFYIANPFSMIYLLAINPWNVHILFTYPIFLLIIYRFYSNYIPLFVILGTVSCILAYTLTNPPQMALFIVSLPFIVLIATVIRHNRFNWNSYLKNLLVAGLGFISFNLWWILHWFIVLPDAQKIYTFAYAKAWLSNQAVVSPMILKNIFSFLWLNPRTLDYSPLANYFNHPFIQTIMFVPFILIFVWIITEMKNSSLRKLIATLFSGMFVLVLFLKGINSPFANIISACFDYVKYCYIFKTAPEKFGVVFVFLTTLVLFFILSETKQKWMKVCMYIYLLILLIPYAAGFYLPDIKIDTADYATRRYKDLPEFQRFRTFMTQKQNDFRILSLPNSGNYQIKMHLYDDKYYTGHNPLLMNIPQSYIADHSGDAYIPLFKNIESESIGKLYGLFSIRYISYNPRIQSWFGNFTEKNPEELLELLDTNYNLRYSDNGIRLYENIHFLPYFWIPESVIPIDSQSTIADLAELLEDADSASVAAYMPQAMTVGERLPVVEYKKINAAKYRIILHGVADRVPLIFNETFHESWQLFLKKIEPADLTKNTISPSYRLLKNNESDQASPDELQSYIRNKWISSSDNNLYVSKLVGTTIQNNNLPDGGIFETDDKARVTEISDKIHTKANVYANAWIIDPAICSTNFCRKNPDGSYDIELVLEYKNQKVLYKNMILTSSIFGISWIILSIWFVTKKRKK